MYFDATEHFFLALSLQILCFPENKQNTKILDNATVQLAMFELSVLLYT